MEAAFVSPNYMKMTPKPTGLTRGDYQATLVIYLLYACVVSIS